MRIDGYLPSYSPDRGPRSGTAVTPYREAQREVAMLERLRDGQADEAARTSQRREQRELDDLTSGWLQRRPG